MMLCIITTSGNGKERSYMYELKAKCNVCLNLW